MNPDTSIASTRVARGKEPGARTLARKPVTMELADLDMLRLSDLFNVEGYVILKHVFDQKVLREVQAEMEKLVDLHAHKLLAAGKIQSLFAEEPFETRLYRLYEACQDQAPKFFRTELHGAGLYHLFFHPIVLNVVENILGGEIRLYPNYTARPKFPDWEGTQVLWHQDGGYTEQLKSGEGGSIEALRMVNVWAPLVPARVENGCMQFVPGTHKLGTVPHLQKEYYLEIAAEHLDPHVTQAVNIEVDPGDVVLFHNLLFHQGLPNRSKLVRWSLDWRYQDATQPTMRKENGHISRSREHPEVAVQSPERWAALSFC